MSLNIKSLATNGKLEVPIVIRNCKQAKQWQISDLTPTKLATTLGEKLVKFRIGQIATERLGKGLGTKIVKSCLSFSFICKLLF